MSGYVPHQDLDAEAAVLSTCMLVPEAYDEVVGVIEAEHFYADANRRVWEVIDHLNRSQAKVDLVAVASRLQQTGRLEQVGGTPYISQLAHSTPAVAHVIDHAKLVRDAWRKRTLEAVLAAKLGSLRASRGVPNDELDTFAQGICADVENVTAGRGTEDSLVLMSDAVRSYVDEVNVRAKETTDGKIIGVPTGIKQLDEVTGGLVRGAKYTVAARPGIGKTGFLCSLSINVARLGFGVVICTIEMPREQILTRMLSGLSGVPGKIIERGKMSPNEWARFTKAATELSHLPIVVEDAGTQTEQTIRSSTRRGLKRLRDKFPNINLGLIGIDYIQIVNPSKKERGESREREVAAISNATRSMAKEFNCPLIELSQLNRSLESRPDKRPIMADLRDSGAIEQDAFGIFMLYRDDYYRKPDDTPDGLAEVLIRKLRNGPTGVVRCKFHAPSASFFELDDAYNDLF